MIFGIILFGIISFLLYILTHMIPWALDKRLICKCLWVKHPLWPLRTPLDVIRGLRWSLGGFGVGTVVKLLDDEALPGLWGTDKRVWGLPPITTRRVSTHTPLSRDIFLTLPSHLLSFICTSSLTLHKGFFLSLCISPSPSLCLPPSLPQSSFL